MNVCNDLKSPQDITKMLIIGQDEKYKDFSSKLIPNINKDRFIGVRTPVIRKLAKHIYGTQCAYEFMSALPHYYIEENHLHAFLIELEKDFDKAIKLTCEFLPYVDNWATCDSFRPKVFRKNPTALYNHIIEFINSTHTYTVRYGIGLLLSFYLDETFDKTHLSLVCNIKSDEYYINMMIAWYFATAIAKQTDYAIPYIEQQKLSKWTHNKTISKAIESFRVDDSTKAYLKTLRVK